MPEKGGGLIGRNLSECFSNRLFQSLNCAGCDAAQDTLDFRDRQAVEELTRQPRGNGSI
jgi:hypothetical protein